MIRAGIVFSKLSISLTVSVEMAVEKRTMSSHGTYNKAISRYT